MATIRESLMKLAEVAKPVPGDEQDFVAKHGMKVMDFQGKDSISQESPYDHILKNVAAIKKPGDPGKDDHGHDAPGESEAAYHIPESRDAKIAKLSEMMGNNKDEEDDEDEDEEDDEDKDKDEDEDDKEEVKEAKQVVGVEMHYKHPTKKPFKVTHFSVQDAERGKKEYEKMGYKLVGKKAQMGEEKDYELSAASFERKRKQKEIASNLLDAEMKKRREERAAKKQAGTMKIKESVDNDDRREANDKEREARVATPRPHTAKTVEGMRYRLQSVKKQVIDKT